MSSSAKNVKLGTCNVFFDGKDLGLTKGGVEVEVSTATKEVTVDQFGNTPIGEIITGRTCSVTAPLAETTLDNLLAIMPGSELVTDGEFAAGSVTFSTAAPVAGDKIEILGKAFTFKANPKVEGDVAIGATIQEAATALAYAINHAVLPVYASAAAGVVTITAEQRGADYNGAIVATVATPANVAVADLAGGVNVTQARVRVSTGVSINLLSLAKELRLRPIGTTGAHDFVVENAACPGALTFSYSLENERIYNAVFKGYASADGGLFSVGDEAAA